MARTNELTDVMTMLQVTDSDRKSLAGEEFCITGHLSKTREEIESIIINAGGRISKTVKHYTILVTNEDWTTGKTSSKYSKAKKYGCRIISENDLIELLCK